MVLAETPAATHAMRAARARQTIELVALRIAPALTGALIICTHLQSAGQAAIVFATMLAAAQLVGRTRLPLHLMPASRILLALAAPVIGALVALVIIGSTGGVEPVGDLATAVAGAWLVLALGAWVTYRLEDRVRVRIAVVGGQEFARDLAEELRAAGVRGYRVAGWIGASGSLAGDDSIAWMGTLGEVRQIVTEDDIELLVCEATSGGDQVLQAIAESCLDLPVRMIDGNQLYEQLLGHVPIGTIDVAWFRYIMHPRFNSGPSLGKRAFDLVVGMAMMVVLSPILAIAAVAVRLGDGGPVLYRQVRVGAHGKHFVMLKLRTMRSDAESDGRAQLSVAGDERVTRAGRVLRRTHVDELPQLWNVLTGEMTLIGPRPERPELVAELDRRYRYYSPRHLVKPGIAGWAQLRCGYAGSDLGTAWKLCHDLFYVKHRSLLADTLILFETCFVTFRDAHRSLHSPKERFLVSSNSASEQSSA